MGFARSRRLLQRCNTKAKLAIIKENDYEKYGKSCIVFISNHRFARKLALVAPPLIKTTVQVVLTSLTYGIEPWFRLAKRGSKRKKHCFCSAFP
jgi:hypothetical protein